MHFVLFVCLLAGVHLVNEQTFVVLFLRSTRPLLCLLKHPPKSKKYRAERPPFFLLSFGVRASIHTLPTNRPISGIFFLIIFSFLCSAMFEVYEAGTLPAETLPPKQEIQGGALVFVFFLLC